MGGGSRDKGCNWKESVSAMSIIIHSSFQNGWSSLMWACRNGHADVAKILVLDGALVNDQNKVSITSPAQ